MTWLRAWADSGSIVVIMVAAAGVRDSVGGRGGIVLHTSE